MGETENENHRRRPLLFRRPQRPHVIETAAAMHNVQKHRQLLHLLAIASTFLIHHVFADDVEVMGKLAKALNPTPSGWTGSDPCEWSDVQCDSTGKVISIDLVGMSLSGELPSDLGELWSLKSLNLRKNQLSGPLPSLSKLGSLEEISLDSNNFSSVPSDFLSGMKSLLTFSISDNGNLSPWTIPKTLADSVAIVSFIASRANIMGDIPDIFDSFPGLQNLRLSYNNITGSLPISFAKSEIHNLWLNNQLIGLTGRIDVLEFMPGLAQVWLHVNQFTGPIPDLSNATGLFDLQLRDNQLTGPIPDSLTALQSLKNVSLQNNMFQGPVPRFSSSGVQVSLGTSNGFCNTSPGPCDSLVTILLEVAGDLGYPIPLAESWTGNNPCMWKYITCDSGRVTVINFAKQNFVGTISPAIANLTSLRSLVLSDNKLTGPIPDSLTALKDLKLLDVSNNNLSGQIPDFTDDVSVKTSGNPFIGVDLPPPSPFSKPIDSPDDSPDQSNNNKTGAIAPWIFVVIAVVIVGIIVLAFVGYKRWVRKSNNNDSRQGLENNGGTTSDTCSSSVDFNVKEGNSIIIPIGVLQEATNNFSKENILGEGGFGVVYKGKLHDGTLVAVKRMQSSAENNRKGLKEFKAEIEVLTGVRHRNLVSLHGFCVNGNERLLVYECMSQGTLGHHLFNWRDDGKSPLTWTTRLTIALDVARGMEYLHSLAQKCFIHRDLKPSNILLGDDMRAKVSDFGLVKSAPDGKLSLETRLAGTFGYLAPEYAATGRVTTKVDVFAFGVILMELITGHKALDDTQPEDRCHLVTWFRKVLVNVETIRSSIDPSLEPDEETFKTICKVAELAGHCTAREPGKRPDMGHVVGFLSPFLVQWTPTATRNDDLSFGIDMSLPEALQRWIASADTASTRDLFD